MQKLCVRLPLVCGLCFGLMMVFGCPPNGPQQAFSLERDIVGTWVFGNGTVELMFEVDGSFAGTFSSNDVAGTYVVLGDWLFLESDDVSPMAYCVYGESDGVLYTSPPSEFDAWEPVI